MKKQFTKHPKNIVRKAIRSQVLSQIKNELKSKYGEDIAVGVSDLGYIDVEVR